ncbi:MAG: flagellar hook-basal body complex protein FliE [Beijerinckiaceae bacterium]
MASPISAANAYAAIQKMGAGGLATAKPASAVGGEGGGGDFGALVKQFVGNTAQSARTAEAKMAQATAGKADLVDVVTAVAESEAALETLVAVRDRVIAAYEEIMRMPI